MFGIKLKERHILGMNSRNLDYIFAQNNRRDYELVDNKLLTKELAFEAGVAVPETYGVVSYHEQLKKLESLLAPHVNFVIKPSQGSGGGGIMVIKGRDENGHFLKANGKAIALEDVKYHISNILGGLYSLGGIRDQAIIERCVENTAFFDDLAFQGVPDIRLIIYQGVPAMAMLRLPTQLSDGRANLHAGGIGVGVCIASGMTTHAVLKNRFAHKHPDTNATLAGRTIPGWEQILVMSTKAGSMVKLGYIGVDVVIDKDAGPMLLEMNARPGISIQIANNAGLKARLDAIDAALPTLGSAEEKVAFARQTFRAQ